MYTYVYICIYIYIYIYIWLARARHTVTLLAYDRGFENIPKNRRAILFGISELRMHSITYSEL